MLSDSRMASSSGEAEVVLRAENLWKEYGLGPALRHQVRRLFGQPDNSVGPWALQDISLQLRRGQSLGVLGRNGAGKSSLLKVLAGVTRASRGHFSLKGRVFPMIELNAGMHTELTGRENLRFLGALMGLPRREIERRMPAFEEFCELGEWFDRPVRMYSSGMLARLGFSIAMNVDADVLLIDEVLSVGDLAFQLKCYDALWNKRKQGVSIVFVSHSLRQMERICDDAVWLEKGRVKGYGQAGEVCAAYAREARSSNSNDASAATGDFICAPGVNSPKLRIYGTDESSTIETGKPTTIEIKFSAEMDIPKPMVVFQLYSADMILVSSITNVRSGQSHIDAGQATLRCHIPQLPLMPGFYAVSMKLRSESDAIVMQGDRILWFEVQDPSFTFLRSASGLISVESSWTFETGAAVDDSERHKREPGELGFDRA